MMHSQIAQAAPNTNYVDEQIVVLVTRIRDHQRAIEEHELEVQTLKTQLARFLEIRGANWSDESGYARLGSAGTRAQYDTNELDMLIIKDPIRYGWLGQYRQESPLAGRVQVK